MNLFSIFQNKAKIWSLIALFMASAVFSFFAYKEVTRISYLYTLDPGFHYTVTQVVDDVEPFGTQINTYDGQQISVKYPSAMRVVLVIVRNVTNLDYLILFKLFGIFCRIFTAAIIFVIVGKLQKNHLVACVSSILFLSSSYIFFRGIISFPENLALPFHLLVFYEVIRSMQRKKITIALPIFFAGSLLIHYASAIIPIILIVVMLGYFLYDVIRKNTREQNITFFKQAGILVIIFLFLSFPVLVPFVKHYLAYARGNIGSDAIDVAGADGDARFLGPAFDGYVSSIGFLLILFSLFSLVYLVRKINREHALVLGWVVVAFLLTRGTELFIYVPTGRMLAYLIIPLVIAASYALREFFEMLKYRTVFFILLTVVLPLNLIATIEPIHGWEATTQQDLEVTQWLNQKIQNTDTVISLGYKALNFGFLPFTSYESRVENLEKIFIDGQINLQYLTKEYGTRKIVLVVNKREFKNGFSAGVQEFENESYVVYSVN